jgi:hypothetical protein
MKPERFMLVLEARTPLAAGSDTDQGKVSAGTRGLESDGTAAFSKMQE